MTLADYWDIAGFHRWKILLLVVVAVTIGLVVSFSQTDRFEATATVAVAAQVSPSPVGGTSAQPQNYASTQASLAESDSIENLAAMRAGVSIDDLSENASVEADGENSLLLFTVEDADPERASLIAEAYAREFVSFRQRLDTSAATASLRTLRVQVGDKEPSGDQRAAIQRLDSLRDYQAANTVLVSGASEADARVISGQPVRTAILSGLLGLTFGIALAIAAESAGRRRRR